jgi:F-type H+-transporting ATPase subunit gamma
VLPEHTLDAERLLAALIRQHLFVGLFRACAESLASEHQMRLRAMQAAERNIQDRMEELVFAFRNHRQDAIDAELLDIGAGFEAVAGVS